MKTFKAIEQWRFALASLAVLALSACSGGNDEDRYFGPQNEAGESPVSTGGSASGSSGGTGGSTGGSSTGGMGGKSGSSGSDGSGGSSKGGSVSSGGTGGSSGDGEGGTGTVANGGSSGSSGDSGNGGTGNVDASGGTSGTTGGTDATGGTTGGSDAVGGSSGDGAGGSTGGSDATGGTDASGGTDAVGGTSGDGGTAGVGGSDATGGTTGGSDAVGGSSGDGAGGSSGGTGGSSGDGGTGAANSTGGSDNGTGGTDPGTGGSLGSGGSDAGAGGSSAGSGGSSGSGGEPPMTPFSYNTPTRDVSFPAGWNLTERGWASGEYDVYVPVTNPNLGSNGYHLTAIQHKTLSGWSEEFFGSDKRIQTVWGNGPDDVYAVGNKLGGDWFYRGIVLHRASDGTWQEVKSWTIGEQVQDVMSITCTSSSNCYVVGAHCTDATHCYPQVWQGSGGSWSVMDAPSLENGYARRVKCDAVHGCFVMGYWSANAFLWHLNGPSWEMVDLGSENNDIRQLMDMDGKDGELTFVGTTASAGIGNGVRLVTEDLVQWDREDGGTNTDISVWMPWKGAALIGGTYATSAGKLAPGYGRLCGRSLSAFQAETAIDASALYPTSILPLSSGKVLITAYGLLGNDAFVYTATYQ
jgi:hypothetical protein